MKIDETKDHLFRPLTARQRAQDGDGFEAALVAAAQPGGNGTYDFTTMTPDEMREVAKSLHDQGKIDLTQLLMLQDAGMPIGRMGPNGEFIPLSDAEKAAHGSQPVNYLKTVTEAMAFLEDKGSTSDPKSGYDEWKGILRVLQDA